MCVCSCVWMWWWWLGKKGPLKFWQTKHWNQEAGLTLQLPFQLSCSHGKNNRKKNSKMKDWCHLCEEQTMKRWRFSLRWKTTLWEETAGQQCSSAAGLGYYVLTGWPRPWYSRRGFLCGNSQRVLDHLRVGSSQLSKVGPVGEWATSQGLWKQYKCSQGLWYGGYCDCCGINEHKIMDLGFFSPLVLSSGQITRNQGREEETKEKLIIISPKQKHAGAYRVWKHGSVRIRDVCPLLVIQVSGTNSRT